MSHTHNPNEAYSGAPMRRIMIEFLAGIEDKEQPRVKIRLEKHLPRLLSKLETLYGNHENFSPWVTRLLQEMSHWYQQRSSILKTLDEDREKNPDWILNQEIIAYSAYVDRFAGTLRGVENRIPHLKSLGIRYLHLLPFLRARAGENDGGFAVESYDEIESELGDMNDLSHLTEVLRTEGISLCSDFVLNHVADSHVWAKSVLQGNSTYRKHFHILQNPQEVEKFEAYLAQVFPQTAPGNFTYNAEIKGWVWTTFYPYQWDLNYANPEVFIDMIGALVRLANRGIEIFRLDSTAYLWKRSETNCMNQPEVHLILQALRAIVDIIAPGVVLKAEAIVPSIDLPPYFGLPDSPGQECHLAYQSSLMTAMWACLAEQDAGLLKQILKNTPPLAAHTTWLTYVRCHDDIGWSVLRREMGNQNNTRLSEISKFYAGEVTGSYAHGSQFQSNGHDHVHGTNGMTSALTGWSHANNIEELANAERRFLLLYSLAFSVGGIPMIYMGDEIALGNDDTHYTAWPQGADGRQLHRPVLTADALATAENTATRPGHFFNQFKKMVMYRQKNPEFSALISPELINHPHSGLLAIKRGGNLLCLFNFTNRPITLTFNITPLTDIHVAMDALTGVYFKDQITLPSFGMNWLEIIGESNPT